MSALPSIVLYEPEIPQNAGNIARLCACTGAELHFAGRLGFSLSDKYLKRSGLDYWDKVKIEHHKTFEDLQAKYKGRYWFFTTKAPKVYSEVQFEENDFLVFGPETRGLPNDIIEKNMEFCLKIPMKKDARSLNLSNAASIAIYESIRQLGSALWI